MADTAFDVTYDGAALEQGQMPVRDLAPALLALGELFAEASALVEPGRKPVALSIRATHEGSFVIRLILESGWDFVSELFSSDAVDALVNLKELVIGGGASLFWLLKHLRGRNVIDEQPGPSPDTIQLILDDDTTVEAPARVLDLYKNIEVRKRAREVVRPLERDGVDRLDFTIDSEITVSVTTGDVDSFEVRSAIEPLEDQVRPMVVSIAQVAFVEDNKWRLTEGNHTFWATIQDHRFLQSVDQGEAFRKGDMLRCRMRIVQTRDADGLHTDYHVVEVTEHIPRGIQLRLPPADP